MPGVAARNAANRQPAATQGAMCLDGVDTVMRTGGFESTVPTDHRTERQLVGPYKKYQDSAHCRFTLAQCCSSLCWISWLDNVPMEGFAMITMSTSGRFRRFSRKDSRISRRRRFRSTARRATFFETAMPRRAVSNDWAANRTIRWESALRFPSRKTRVNAAGFSNRN